MNALYYCEIAEGLTLPDFGEEFALHMQNKRHPGVRAASLSAWNLLAEALRRSGTGELPCVHFFASGKPAFSGSPLHFSIAHSGNLAAVLLSDVPCGVDIELIRPEVSRKLYDGCLAPREKQRADLDFFTFWTRKECIGKLLGCGIDAHPAQTDTLSPEFASLQFHTETVFDISGREYRLSAVLESGIPAPLQKITF